MRATGAFPAPRGWRFLRPGLALSAPWARPAASVLVGPNCTGLKCAELRLGHLRRGSWTRALKIAKPLLLVSTPLGVAWGLLEAYRLAGGLVILMAAMIGALVPDERKRELVELLNKHDIPIIEDDVYAELFFGRQRPKPLKAFDRKGLVLNCNSFSKSLAPGYRVGWVAAGRFATALQRRKLMSSLSTSAPAQDAIALYLRDGGYERRLSTLRRALAKQQATALESLVRHLPANVRISRPEGGYFLWLEMPESQDAIEIHRRALGKLLSHPQLSSSAAAR